jgi:hypothetical protein
MPEPRKKEKKIKFLARCIPVLMSEPKAKTLKQAVAICAALYDQPPRKNV